MVTVVVFEFSVMRCQPLRRALVIAAKVSLSSNRFKILNLIIFCISNHITNTHSRISKR